MPRAVQHTGVIDLAAACVDRFQQLVHFFITHLLAEIGQDCVQRVSHPQCVSRAYICRAYCILIVLLQ